MNSILNQIIKKAVLVLFIATIVLSTSHAQAQAVTVRGKLEGHSEKGSYPVAGIAVTLKNASGVRTEAVYSDSQGLYQISDVTPGTYTLEIWVNENNPMKFKIEIPKDKQVFDIKPIVVKKS